MDIKKPLSLSATVALAATLAGCAGNNGFEARRQAAIDHVESVCSPVASDPRLSTLQGQLPSRADQASESELTSRARPAAAQQSALQAYAQDLNSCWSAQYSFAQTYEPPDVTNVLARFIETDKGLLAGLLAGKYSYGEYNAARAVSFANMKKAARQARYNAEALAAPPASAADATAPALPPPPPSPSWTR
jgi:hypothetical protein